MRHERGHGMSHSGVRHTHHGFDDPAAAALRLDTPEREAWQKPEDVITAFQLPGEATVAEIGAGTGYFVVRLARRLPRGTVIGLDSEPKMIAYLGQRAAVLGLTNVDARHVAAGEALPFTEAEQLDLLFCVDTYHHIPHRVPYFASYAKHLKPDGKLVIIERSLNAPEGPPADMRVPAETVEKELAQAGFTHVQTLDFLLPYQYYLTFALTGPDSAPG